MIPSEKREKLAKEWGLSEAQITALETMNAEDASKAASAGIESKELKEGEQPVAVTETPVSEGAPTADGAVTNPGVAAQAPVVEPPASVPAPLTVEGVQEALRSAFAEAIQPFADKLNALESELKELSKADEQKIVKEAAGTPMASLAALLGQTVQSAIGNPLTRVDGRTELAKSKPVEADPAAASARTPVPFINEFLAKSQ